MLLGGFLYVNFFTKAVLFLCPHLPQCHRRDPGSLLRSQLSWVRGHLAPSVCSHTHSTCSPWINSSICGDRMGCLNGWQSGFCMSSLFAWVLSQMLRWLLWLHAFHLAVPICSRSFTSDLCGPPWPGLSLRAGQPFLRRTRKVLG